MFGSTARGDMFDCGPSSQTTSSWEIIAPEGLHIYVDSASLNAGDVVVVAPGERSWDRVMERVLRERARTWEELAAL